jgi:rhodanese-related sulfurtransferase
MSKTGKLAVAVAAAAFTVGLTELRAEGTGSGTGDGDKAGKCTEQTCPAAKTAVKHPEIGTEHLQTLLRSGVPLVVLDARTGKYDDGTRIPGARSLSPAADAETAAKAVPSKETLVVTYCAGTHCPASGMLANHLSELGYKNIFEYPQGIEGWVKAGQEVTHAK